MLLQPNKPRNAVIATTKSTDATILKVESKQAIKIAPTLRLLCHTP